MRRFVGRPIVPGEGWLTPANGREPPVPLRFRFGDREYCIASVVRAWRSAKNDRGDIYLKRHWFALQTACGCTLEVYYDREARRGAPHWWLHAIDEPK